jgi:D-xylose transport system ATP-binding protein
MNSLLLETRNIVKRFGEITALNRVSFDLFSGEIHAICGENGAGKSTLIKLLSGIHPAHTYEGELLVDGNLAQFRSFNDAQSLGISVIYQELALVDEISIAENIFLGNEPRNKFGIIDWHKIQQATTSLLAEFGLQANPKQLVGTLGIGQKQLIEIIKALSKQSRILILDEPTAALAEHEVQTLLQILRQLKQKGIACIYISHRLEEVFAISDRITVIRDGASVSTTFTSKTTQSEVIRQMVGREISDLFPRRTCSRGNVLLSVQNLSVSKTERSPQKLHSISFDVYRGEVLGIGGLMGSGRSELLMHLFGLWGVRKSGSIILNQRSIAELPPHERIKNGLGLVSEDRRRYGLILQQSIDFNLSLSTLSKITSRGFLSTSLERTRNTTISSKLKIKAPHLSKVAGELSGGNQQKVVLGKILLTEPDIILLDEPTRGIDVGAKLEIYEMINQLTSQGKGIVLVSSELPELMGMSDRIMMLHEGRLSCEFARESFSQETLLAAALGHHQKTSSNSPQGICT